MKSIYFKIFIKAGSDDSVEEVTSKVTNFLKEHDMEVYVLDEDKRRSWYGGKVSISNLLMFMFYLNPLSKDLNCYFCIDYAIDDKDNSYKLGSLGVENGEINGYSELMEEVIFKDEEEIYEWLMDYWIIRLPK